MNEAKESEQDQFRDNLRYALIQFRDHVAPLAADIALSVPDYTDHSIEHCDALWDTASLLTGTDFPLNPAEAFVLGGAFLVHDLGMGLPAYEGGLAALIDNPAWVDLLAFRHRAEWESIQSQLIADLSVKPTWDGISDIRAKSCLTEYLRSRHAKQAEEIVNTHWKLSNGQEFYLIADNRLRFHYGTLIGRIARSHWIDVDDLPAMFQATPVGSPPGYPSSWTVDPLKLACLLRLADAIQIDGRRADPLHTPHRDPQGVSRDHWLFQERMLMPQCIDGRVVYTSVAPLGAEKSSAWWLAFDTAQMIDAELRRVDALSGDLSKPRFTAAAVAGAESPDRFASFVPVDGWEPIDARPRISNTNQVILSLGGSNLYGSGPHERQVAIREILANALDATRARRSAKIGIDIPPIHISLTTSESRDSISFRDYGIGMTEKTITNSLCDFGRSGWWQAEMSERFSGILKNGFTPTGRYGIGFFSAFMIADDIKVVTRAIEGGWNDTLVLEFHRGLSERPVLRAANTEERLADPGTEVTLHLRVRMTERGGLFEGLPITLTSDPERFSRGIRSLALMSDETITVSTSSSTERFTAIRRNEWQDMTATDLFDALNPNIEERTPPEIVSTIRQGFAESIKPIFDADGALIGRIGLRQYADWYYFEDGLHVNTFSIYCGGLEASGAMDSTYGVIQGTPSRAQRDLAKINLNLEDLRTWFAQRCEEIDWFTAERRFGLDVQNFGVRLGIRLDDQPIVLGERGYLSPNQLIAELQLLDEVFLVESFINSITIGETEYHGWTAAGTKLCTPSGPQYICASAFSNTIFDYREETLPFRPNEMQNRTAARPSTTWEFDPIEWWNRYFASSLGEFVRLLSQAWNIDLGILVESIERCSRKGVAGADTRIISPCAGGGEAKSEGYRFVRI